MLHVSAKGETFRHMSVECYLFCQMKMQCVREAFLASSPSVLNKMQNILLVKVPLLWVLLVKRCCSVYRVLLNV